MSTYFFPTVLDEMLLEYQNFIPHIMLPLTTIWGTF